MSEENKKDWKLLKRDYCNLSKRGRHWYVKRPKHPRAVDGHIPFYVLIVEDFLCRYLKPEEVVHFIDGDETNIHPDNLYVYKNSEKYQEAMDNIEKIWKALLFKGYIHFNRESGKYVETFTMQREMGRAVKRLRDILNPEP